MRTLSCSLVLYRGLWIDYFVLKVTPSKIKGFYSEFLISFKACVVHHLGFCVCKFSGCFLEYQTQNWQVVLQNFLMPCV
jgi:hypothetical protein